jgi:hypothetical protein
MSINWLWNSDKSTDDQRFLQLAHDVATLHRQLSTAVQRIEALEQQAAQYGQTQSDMRATLTEVATVMRRWDGE